MTIAKTDYATSVTDTSKATFEVTSGPNKGLVGYAVDPAEVRGDSRRAYIRSALDGLVYEVSPTHVRRIRAKRKG